MKGREQKTFDKSKTSRQRNRIESEGYVGEQTFMWISKNNHINNPKSEERKLKNLREPNGTHAGVREQLRK